MQLMILGRFIYGLGGESLGITSSVIVVVWFSGKDLSFTNVIIHQSMGSQWFSALSDQRISSAHY